MLTRLGTVPGTRPGRPRCLPSSAPRPGTASGGCVRWRADPGPVRPRRIVGQCDWTSMLNRLHLSMRPIWSTRHAFTRWRWSSWSVSGRGMTCAGHRTATSRTGD